LNHGEPRPDLRSVMLFYLMVFVLLLIFGSLFQAWYFEAGMILTQLLLILLPALLYWRRYRVDYAAFARLQPLQGRFIPTIILLSVSFWLINLVIAAVLVTGLMELGYEPVVVLEPPQTIQQYLGYLAVISIAAGICEEVLFRGTIMPALEESGIIPAVVFSSLLFALFHLSFLSLFSTFVLGVVMAVVVIKTGSLWGGVFYHMLNNFYVITYLYIAGHYETEVEVEPQGLLFLLIFLIPALALAYYGLRLLHKQSPVGSLLCNRKSWFPRGWFGWPLVVGLVIFLVLAMIELALGFGWF